MQSENNYNENRCKDNTNRITEIEKANLIMHQDIKHIKGRIDNGISETITKIWDKINEDMSPHVKENTYWVGALKTGILWLALVAVPILGGVLAIAFYMIQKN